MSPYTASIAYAAPVMGDKGGSEVLQNGARIGVCNDARKRFAGNEFVLYGHLSPPGPHDLVHRDRNASGAATRGHILLSMTSPVLREVLG